MHVKVELLPKSDGGLLVKDLIRNIHPQTSVAKGSDLFISARGSDGEDGGNGGDGSRGERGYDGEDATQYNDATVRH
jgi:hypothetical protein